MIKNEKINDNNILKTKPITIDIKDAVDEVCIINEVNIPQKGAPLKATTNVEREKLFIFSFFIIF